MKRKIEPKFPVGAEFIITENIPTPFFLRLNNIGITEGSRLYIKFVSPLGDPLIVTCRNTDYAMRQTSLATINMKRTE